MLVGIAVIAVERGLLPGGWRPTPHRAAFAIACWHRKSAHQPEAVQARAPNCGGLVLRVSLGLRLGCSQIDFSTDAGLQIK